MMTWYCSIYTKSKNALLGRTKFPFPTKKQDEEFQRKNTDSITRARQAIESETLLMIIPLMMRLMHGF